VFKLSYEYTGRNEHLSYGGHHEIADIFGVDYDESRELFSCQRPSNQSSSFATAMPIWLLKILRFNKVCFLIEEKQCRKKRSFTEES
jgi:hypothetical protein